MMEKHPLVVLSEQQLSKGEQYVPLGKDFRMSTPPIAPLALLSIADLCKMKFRIPSYQRGYRWTPREITRLLDDIWDFQSRNNRDTFYCLQPICVAQAPEGDEWIVVDGQQRLTTILLVLLYAAEWMRISRKNIFSIRYETRESINEFLGTMNKDKTPEAVSDNQNEAIERFYLQQAFCTIHEWFKKLGNDHYLNFMTVFTNPAMQTKSVRVIWYDTNPGQDTAGSIELFNRINSGKIPLTNAELIKALFFKGREEPEQLRMSEKWNEMENALEDDEFWFFLYNGSKDYTTRIELLFDLYLENSFDLEADYDRYQLFYDFKKEYEIHSSKVIWSKIIEIYERLREWYFNRYLFHRIGYLIQAEAENENTILKADSQTMLYCK